MHAISWFQFGGDTYIVEDLSNDAVYDSDVTIDLIVKLTGLVDLSTSTLMVGSTHTLLVG